MGDRKELGASSFWLKFFTTAGIPKDEAAMYAVTFTKHRITQSMLPELSKEYLGDLGIKLMGDVIAILKHARSFYSETVKNEALQEFPDEPVRAAAVGGQRAQNVHLNSKPVSQRISFNSASPAFGVKQSIRATESPMLTSEESGSFSIKMPTGNTARSAKILQAQAAAQVTKKPAIKNQLDFGSAAPTTGGLRIVLQNKESRAKGSAVGVSKRTTTINRQTASSAMDEDDANQQSFFAQRVALKRPATSTVDSDEDMTLEVEDQPLRYAGVLKNVISKTIGSGDAQSVKRPKFATTMPMTAMTNRTISTGVSSAALASDLEGGRKVTIRDRLGQNTVVAKATSTTGRVGSSSVTMVRLAPPAASVTAVRAQSATMPARVIATARRSQPTTVATGGRLAGRLGQVPSAGQQGQSAGVLGQAAAVMARTKPVTKPPTMIRTSSMPSGSGTGSSITSRLGSGARPVGLASNQAATTKSLASRLGTRGGSGIQARLGVRE